MSTKEDKINETNINRTKFSTDNNNTSTKFNERTNRDYNNTLRVELVVDFPLVKRGDHEVVLERLAVATRRAQLAAARPAGQEHEHRVLRAAPADHQGKVMPTDFRPSQLAYSARAVRIRSPGLKVRP